MSESSQPITEDIPRTPVEGLCQHCGAELQGCYGLWGKGWGVMVHCTRESCGQPDRFEPDWDAVP
ncbi:MAG: hypothetical protein AAF851_05795 [Myxococcota bacterium]